MEKKTTKSVVIGISLLVVVTLVLLGLTYAYYRTRVIGNQSTDPSISVQSKKMEIVYEDGLADMNMTGKIEPTFRFTKEFKVINNGDALVEDYIVYMENVVNTFTYYTDLEITLVCNVTKLDENGDSVSAGTCNGITAGDGRYFPRVDEALVVNSIDVGETHNYTLTLTYKETNTDQSIDMGKTLEGKVQIYDAGEKYSWYKEGDQIKSRTTDIVYTIGDKVTYADTGLKSGETVSIDSLYDANDTYKNQHYVNGGSNADLTTGTINRTEFDWIVMGIKDSETLLITTPKNYYVSVIMNMDDVTPINVIDEQFGYTQIFLDNIIKAVYGEEARSIKASDVNNVVNYEPTGGVTHSGEGENEISLNNFTTKVKDIPAAAYSGVINKALPVYFNNGTCTDKASCTFDLANHLVNGYFYDISEENVMTPVVDPGKTITDLEWEVLYSSENSTLDIDKQGYWLNDLGLRISDSSKIYYGFGTVFRQIGTDFLRMFLPIDSFKSVGSNRTYNKVLRPVIEVKDQALTVAS